MSKFSQRWSFEGIFDCYQRSRLISIQIFSSFFQVQDNSVSSVSYNIHKHFEMSRGGLELDAHLWFYKD